MEETTTQAPTDNLVQESLLTQEPSVQVPSKFIKDGNPDYESLTKSYVELEKKLGSKIPVADPIEYDFEFKDQSLWDSQVYDQFKQQAVEMGLSKDQFNSALSIYEDQISGLLDSQIQSPERAQSELQSRWGKDFDSNMKLAQKAFKEFVPADYDVNKIGNNPDVIELLSYVGRQLNEDTGPSIERTSSTKQSLSRLEIEEYMKRPDYWQNNEVQNIVSNWYNNQ